MVSEMTRLNLLKIAENYNTTELILLNVFKYILVKLEVDNFHSELGLIKAYVSDEGIPIEYRPDTPSIFLRFKLSYLLQGGFYHKLINCDNYVSDYSTGVNEQMFIFSVPLTYREDFMKIQQGNYGEVSLNFRQILKPNSFADNIVRRHPYYQRVWEKTEHMLFSPYMGSKGEKVKLTKFPEVWVEPLIGREIFKS